MGSSKKGKVNAKKAAPKAQAKKEAPAKAAVKSVEKSVLATPAKGDIVVAFGKYYLVHTSSKTKGVVVGKHLPMIECGMSGANWHREIQWTQITAIYKDAGYRG